MSAPWDANPGWSSGSDDQQTTASEVFGTPGDGKVPVWNATTGRLEWGAGGGGSVPSITYMALSGASLSGTDLVWGSIDESAGDLLTLDPDTGHITVNAEADVSMSASVTVTVGDASDWRIGFTDNDSPTFGPPGPQTASGKRSAHSATYRFDAGDVIWAFVQHETGSPTLAITGGSQNYMFLTAIPVTSADPNP